MTKNADRSQQGSRIPKKKLQRRSGDDCSGASSSRPESDETKPSSAKRGKKRKKPLASEWSTKCLNEKCDNHHRIKDCEITDDAEKSRLLK